MLQILSHTPPFVFVLFFVLLGFGFLQTRSRKIKPVVAFILPAFMVILSAVGVTSTAGISAASIALWLSGLLLVTCGLYKFFPLKGVVYVAPENKLFVPGSWIPFFVIMAIFFTKYAVGIALGMQLPVVHKAGFMELLSFIYGCFSGYFVSRSITLHRAMREHRGKH